MVLLSVISAPPRHHYSFHVWFTPYDDHDHEDDDDGGHGDNDDGDGDDEAASIQPLFLLCL